MSSALRLAAAFACLAFVTPVFAQETGAPAEPAVVAPATEPAPATTPVAPKRVVPPKPATTLSAVIDLSAQRMTVSTNGEVRHVWPISSGARGFETPTGTFRPQHFARMHYSRKYDLAPMPHSVFINGGIAVHATQATGRLGQAASHGCIRLAPGNAAQFFAMAQSHGAAHTVVRVTGHARQSGPAIARARRSEPGPRYAMAAPQPAFNLFGWQPAPPTGYRTDGRYRNR